MLKVLKLLRKSSTLPDKGGQVIWRPTIILKDVSRVHYHHKDILRLPICSILSEESCKYSELRTLLYLLHFSLFLSSFSKAFLTKWKWILKNWKRFLSSTGQRTKTSFNFYIGVIDWKIQVSYLQPMIHILLFYVLVLKVGKKRKTHSTLNQQQLMISSE